VTDRTAAQQWRAELASWAIDPAILAAAPENPYTFSPALFRADATTESTPSSARAREALPEGGTVLDVGAGAGAASLPLAPRAARIVAVDTQPSMLDALESGAAERGVPVTRVDGSWPDIAGGVPTCDVVVCAHVAYNVPDLGAFAGALTDHARHRVVMELHTEHPWVPLAPLWEHFHHQPRPTGPTAALAVEVLREHGIEARSQSWVRPPPVLTEDLVAAHVAVTRRRLCLPADRDPEVAAQLATKGPQARVTVTLWWDT
jgi:SAM-dependent methyltransferase